MYYIVDTTKKNEKGESSTYVFKTLPEIINHLEGTCKRYFKQNRKDHMFELENLGYQPDEATGQYFVEHMSEYFNIGVVRSDSTPIRTNIFNAKKFFDNKETMGN